MSETIKQPIAQVLLPTPIDVKVGKDFSYLIPENTDVQVGDIVAAPFGKRDLIGVVTGLSDEVDPKFKLKPLTKVYHELPPLTAPLLKLIDWVAQYTMAPRGMVLKMAMPVKELDAKPETQKVYQLGQFDISVKMTAKRQAVVNALREHKTLSQTQLIHQTQASPAVLKPLVEQGVLVMREEIVEHQQEIPKLESVTLNAEQAEAVQHIEAWSPDLKPILIDGVTGSGKTEVYFETIQQILDKDPEAQCLILLPEISLSSQWLTRFVERFGVRPTLWHSNLTPAQRRDNWLDILHGRARVIVGARSALFLPYQNLSLMVVDEEHDGSYKQEETVIYNARDMAIVRSKLEKCPILLASATPSIETTHNVANGHYHRLQLTNRHAGAQLPAVTLVDLKTKKKGEQHWISPALYEEMTTTLDRGEQVLLYLNRRGFAPMTICRSCGEKSECPYCSAWLVHHNVKRNLVCHHCGHTVNVSQDCHECGTVESLVPCGPGVERVWEEVSKRFPEIKCEIASSDHLTTQNKTNELIKRFQNQETQVLIGTQMITKGYHFPNLTLVGVIDGDQGLDGSDLRAGEKTYQLLHQVAGRAGRAEKPGRVYIQTFAPEQPVFKAIKNHDRDAFIAAETRLRELRSMPPYGRLAAIILSAPDQGFAEKAAFALSKHRPNFDGIQILGPAPAALAMIRGRYRWRFLIKGAKQANLQHVIQDWLKDFKVTGQLKLQIDIDPYSFV